MYCKIVIINLFCTICTELVLAHKANVKMKVDENKLKEISGFEKDGVIVQPEWTQSVIKGSGPNKVVITQENLKESAAIREEIQYAVNSGKYVNGNSGLNTTQADHYLGLHFRSKNVLSNMVGTESNKSDTEVVGNIFDDEIGTNAPNIIKGIALDDDIDIGRLKQLELSNRRTREILVVKEIIEDLSFDLGEDVKAWKHLLYDGRDYYIGLRDVDVVIVQKDSIKYEEGYAFNVGLSILYFETFHFWSTESETQEGFIIIAINEKLLWYQVHSTHLFWEWFIGLPTTMLLYFKIGNLDYIALSSNQSSKSELFSLNIYQFDIRSKEFWIAQTLKLESECIDVAFLDTGKDAVLAVVQRNSALIFTFNPYPESGSHIKFEHKNTIRSESIQSVACFRMGGYSYIAIGGLSPKILHYTQEEFVPKTILGQNFGLVDIFLPIPARTYRDDMLILVQHRVDFESHVLVILETLIWDGNVFDTIAPAPCIIGNYTFSHDISCLLDVQRESGIKGSAILKKDDNVFIIVPRNKAESGLFQIKTELLSKNSELIDLKEIFDFLKEWVNEHDELINDAFNFLENDRKLPPFSSNESESYNKIRGPEIFFGGEIGTLYLNEYQWTGEDIRVDLNDLIGEIERMDISLENKGEMIRNRRELTYDTLDFETMDTENLVFQLLNGEKSWITNSNLIFNNTIIFDALWVIGDIRLSAARATRNSAARLSDLDFDEINGIKWNHIFDNVIFKNFHFKIDELFLIGELVAEGNTNAYNINGLTFPDNLLWSSGPQSSIIQAKKLFISTLTVHAVDTGGLLNNINPFDLISLTEEQNITGIMTFTQLEVSERMHVNGTVHGRGLTKFLSNPSLLESNTIHSMCTFQYLEVRGPVLISEKYNDINFDNLLNEVVYLKTDTIEMSIHSDKHFNILHFIVPLNSYNHNVNGISLNLFLTTSTIQYMDIRNISGNIYFHNISLNGVYDTVTIDSLIEETIHNDSEITLNEYIKFNDICWSKSIGLHETLNGMKKFNDLQSDLNINTVTFELILSDNFTTVCNIIGAGHVYAGPLHPVPYNRNVNAFVQELILKSSIQTEMIHYALSELFILFLRNVEDITSMIWKEKIIVKSIHINGDVQVMKLNYQNFDDEIQLSTISLNRPNYLHIKLLFKEITITFGNLHLTGLLSKQNISNIIKDIVRKISPFEIKTNKLFSNIIQVTESNQMGSIGNTSFMVIATKHITEKFLGNIYINGTLSCTYLNLSQIVNGHLSNFGLFFRFDKKMNTLLFLGENKFINNLNIKNLNVQGKVNSIENVEDFIENLVYKNSICMLKGRTTFKNSVTIKKGAYIRNLNGYNMAYLIKNVVFINHPDPFLISASVIFKESIRGNDITLKGSFSTHNLLHCFLLDWMQDTLRTNKPSDIAGILRFLQGAIKNNFLQSVYVNNLVTGLIVPLESTQNISNRMSFSDIYISKFIKSEIVNQIHFQPTLDNSLMVYGNRHVTTPLIIHSCDTLLSLSVCNLASNLLLLNNIVELSDGLEIDFAIFFLKVNTTQIQTISHLTGKDIIQWLQNSLISKNWHEIVESNWIIRSLQTSYSRIGQYTENIDKHNIKKGTSAMQIYGSFVEVCKRSSQIVRNERKIIVKYVEKSFTIVEQEDIARIFIAGDSNRSYLIINIRCQMKIFAWKAKHGLYGILHQFNSGKVDQILTFPFENQTFYLVTMVETPIKECTWGTVNVWYFDQQRMEHIKTFSHSDISMIHPSSKNMNAFYAISENNRKIFRLAIDSSEEQAWDLPISGNESYRFLPQDADLGIALSNGHHILLLNSPPGQTNLRKRRSSVSTGSDTKAKLFSESMKIEPLEFFQALENELLELTTNLNIQILDSQHEFSSINVDNEFIYKEFTMLIDKILRKKELLEISDLMLNKTAFLNNRSIVFVCGIVKIIWPVFEKIENLDKKMVHTEDENVSQICSNIRKIFNSCITDIVHMGTLFADRYLDNNMFSAIISRVKMFQKEINDVIYKVKHIYNIISVKNDHKITSELPTKYYTPYIPNPLQEPFIAQSIFENNFLVANSPHLPTRAEGEIIPIQTGTSGNTRTFIAALEDKMNALKIYFDIVPGSLFQTLFAYRPSFLCAFRIENQSFLVLVESKYIIRIMIYKGIRGFVDLLKYELYEPVSSLNYVSVSGKIGTECLKHFLIVNNRKNIDFYEIILTGNCSSKDVKNSKC